jgi:hypothetical protein
LNPLNWLKIPHLERKLNIEYKEREEKERLLERERQEKDRLLERERQEKDRLLESERKVIKIIYDGSDEESPLSLSRKVFSTWISDNKLLEDLNREVVLDFEDVHPGGTYFFVKKVIKTNFDGYAEHEAARQTKDCVDCIRSGKLFLPPFNEDGTIVYYEYDIPFSKDIEVPGNKFKSPVRPDALLIKGSEWLVLESKHAFTNKHLNTFQAKCDFIERHADKPWVRRTNPVPTKITFVACSVNTFPKEELEYPEIVKVVREGLDYKLATSK